MVVGISGSWAQELGDDQMALLSQVGQQLELRNQCRRRACHDLIMNAGRIEEVKADGTLSQFCQKRNEGRGWVVGESEQQ